MGVDVVVIGATSPRHAFWFLLIVVLPIALVGWVLASDLVGFAIVAVIVALFVVPLGWSVREWRRAMRFAQSRGWDVANCALGYVEFFSYSSYIDFFLLIVAIFGAVGGSDSRGWARFTPTGGVARGLPRPGEYALVAAPVRRRGVWIYGRLSGCRVEEGPYRGYMLAVLDPSMAKSVSGELSVSTPRGDYAHAVVKPVEPGLVEVVVEARLVEARAARLELVAKTPEKTHKVKLAESRGGVVREVVDLRGLAGPKVVIIAGTPGGDALDLFSNGVAGLGFGPTYALRLVLDVPQAGEVAVEQEITPTSF